MELKKIYIYYRTPASTTMYETHTPKLNKTANKTQEKHITAFFTTYSIKKPP